MRWMVFLLIFTLAGCADAADESAPAEQADAEPACDEACMEDPLRTDDGRDLRTDLLATDTVPAPLWNVGDVFEQHLYFGSNDNAGRHIQTVVTAASSSGYTIQSAAEDAARWDAMYDYPILGDIGPGLETSFFGSDGSWMYQFPLGDGDTWNGVTEQLINWNSYSFTDFELTMTSTYDGAIDTPHGKSPGFWIEAATADGDVLMRYNYVPALGWFSDLWVHDLETQDPTDTMFHATSMGVWSGFDGFHYEAEIEDHVNTFYGVFPNPADPAGTMQGEPAPNSFDVDDSKESVMGILVPIAAGGRTEIVVTQPGGDQIVCDHQQMNLQGASFEVCFVDRDATGGDWNLRTLNVGAFTGYYIWLASLDVIEHVMASEV